MKHDVIWNMARWELCKLGFQEQLKAFVRFEPCKDGIATIPDEVPYKSCVGIGGEN